MYTKSTLSLRRPCVCDLVSEYNQTARWPRQWSRNGWNILRTEIMADILQTTLLNARCCSAKNFVFECANHQIKLILSSVFSQTNVCILNAISQRRFDPKGLNHWPIDSIWCHEYVYIASSKTLPIPILKGNFGAKMWTISLSQHRAAPRNTLALESFIIPIRLRQTISVFLESPPAITCMCGGGAQWPIL